MTDSETSPTRLIWLDLETTGLDPEKGVILEVAARATDVFGRPVDGPPPYSAVFRHAREGYLTKMDNYVLSMHLRSGLLEKALTDNWGLMEERENDRQWRNLEQRFRTWAWARGEPKHTYLAGNSIHFDRAWLAVHAPWLLKFVSHRMLDVSAFKVAAPDLYPKQGEVAHRALDDVNAALAAYREIRQSLGLPQGGA